MICATYSRCYVRVYKKNPTCETWQTLGPYDYDVAVEIMYNYLKKGLCSWIEDVKISE